MTLFTSKVDLGTGIETALAQIAAEELDVSWKQINVITGDTALTVDQSATSAAAARLNAPARRSARPRPPPVKSSCRLAAERLGIAADKLSVKDGVVTALGSPSKKYPMANSSAARNSMLKSPPKAPPPNLNWPRTSNRKSVNDYQTVGTTVQRFDLPPKLTGEAIYINDLRIPACCRAA